MTTYVQARTAWVQQVGDLQFPAGVDHRLQELMTLNNEGLLTQDECGELNDLVELSERISLLRAEALQLLG